ncbi:protein of unknown function DUF820 [[Leptolyngbya] sp. PCC 7376]|uniref:Uma2 family endonuclease n=1 Tax=[Leptolyngbya] sp. PCC 7376 TaxID=111781 RepID=UPI00029EE58C|nr:Uma2 family endonuclease [[Leptolyngbya] sp. PCC 7376]AFY38566.1 protein of unknown function DUF820 [[Leptolyngbya] sp. PCC 7376]
MRTLTKWTVSEYHNLIQKGILDHKRVELLDGELVEMAPESPLHRTVMDKGNDYLRSLLHGKAGVYEGHPITLTNSEPEPDIVVVQLPKSQYSERHPNASEIFLLIEVAKSTLSSDLSDKKNLYQKEGIKEYWVIDLVNNQLHIFKDLINAQYRSMTIYTEGNVIPNAFPNLEISVAKLLN